MASIDYYWLHALVTRCAVLSTLVGLLGACGGAPRQRPADPSATNVVRPSAEELAAGDTLPGSYVVTFRSTVAGPPLRQTSFFAEYRAHHALLDERYGADPRVVDMQYLTSIDLVDPGREADADAGFAASPLLRLAWSQNPGQAQTGVITRVDFRSEDDAASALGEWEQRGDLWFAEPNYVSRLAQEPDPAPATEVNLFRKYADDYGKFPYWWLTAINLTSAYEAIAQRDLSVEGTPTDADIASNRPIIAVLDSGVDYEHPALAGRIWENHDVNAANCDNDVHGCNTTVARRGKLGNGDVYPFATSGPGQTCDGLDPNCSHGTHVAGIIAGDSGWTERQTGRAAPGLCPVCQIMILKIVSRVGKESGILDSSIIAAFKYVTLFRRANSPAVRVINASFGKFVRSRAVGLLIRLMRDKNGTLLVAAAGNEDTLTQEYPAAFKDAVAVAAVDNRLRKVNFSNFGQWVDVSAPGQAILSTVPGGDADTKSGTSMATPMVSGIAGLLVARYPGIAFDDLRGALLQTADPTFYGRDFEDGFNYTYYYPLVGRDKTRTPLLGYGVLDAQAAINRAPTTGLPIFNQLDRVRPGCSTIPLEAGRAAANDAGRALLLIAGFLPIIGAVLTRGARRRRPPSGA
jgi:subtilisin family serine protease